MKTFHIVVIIAAAAASAKAGLASRNESAVNAVPSNFCYTLANGNYDHPDDCTKFVSCSNRIAYEMNCATCHIDPLRCPTGRTVFDASKDQCVWADETTCHSSGLPTNPTTTTEPTTTSDPTSTTSGESSTTASTTTSQPPGVPGAGQPCDPLDCKTTGYCEDYLRCDETLKVWVAEKCGRELLWNPDAPRASIHGGNCDFWDNLTPAKQDEYNNDKNCLRCYWEETGECERDYKYQEKGGLYKNPQTISCSKGLVFDLDKETCVRCEEKTKKSDGNKCTDDCLAVGNVP